MKITTYNKDGKIRCPYCNSIQVKRANSQPKKYPFIKAMGKFNNKDEADFIADFWANGFNCKKCGEEFLLKSSNASTTPVPTTISNLNPFSAPKPTPTPAPRTPTPKKKKGGFLWKLTFWVLLVFFGLVAWGYFDNQHSPKHTKTHTVDTANKSQNKNDTLSITETHTVKNKD